jgi:DNA-binding transcriptional LysR family regulator
LHVLPAVNEFLANYPDIDVRLLLSDRNVHLIDDHVDLAVRIGALADSSMVAVRVGSVRRVVCASPTFLAGHGTPKAPEDLSALACVTFDALTSSTAWNFTTADSRTERAVALRSRLSVNTAEAAVDAAISGVGVTRVLSYQAANAVAEGKLRIVLAKYESEPLPINIVHIGQSLLPLKTRAFLDFVAPRIRERAAKVDVLTR